MSKILVIKFGGTSLMTTDRIKHAANIVAGAREHNRVVVVVSAMGHTTDELLEMSSHITKNPNLRELDALMATGEIMAASLMTMALQRIGLEAKSFSGVQAGLLTDSHFGNAGITQLDPRPLERAIKNSIIPVIAGFQGCNGLGDITTIGRGGSDTTALTIASVLNAERCDIYSDVDGVYTCDPNLVQGACKLSTIATSEMLEMAKAGAQILNARSVEVARDKNVQIRVRSTFAPSDQGTLVEPHSVDRSFTGIALRRDLACVEIHLEKLELAENRDLKTFPRRRLRTKRSLVEMLGARGILAEAVDPCKPNPFKIMLIMTSRESATAAKYLRESELDIKDILIREDFCAVGVVASQITHSHYLDATEQLLRSKIDVLASAMHEQRLTFVIPDSVARHTLEVLHSHFRRAQVAA